ncbi:recombinase family protein [Microvirga sp. 17 mud 1-3]|uniref:recombinase family protein n=1 Tax=Microvirga sp. 17 mud 1-3 TaxID=2082949 RepID=UPI000D6CDAEB|nr:recombinase family protein [Microvirga sp. 17 mud 1-3]AWM86809.1 DNA invertase [Microvirga sp. 17 mud 1-3]
MLVGLARTSTTDQKAGLEHQIEMLKKLGCEKLFVEETSSVGQRPVLEQATDWVREGDALCVTTLSRLARSVPHLWQIIQRLEEKKVSLRIIDMGVDTATSNGRLLLNLIGSIVQWEREILLERQKIGIKKAQKDGKFRGRVPVARRQTDEIIRLKNEGMAPADIAKALKVGRSSVYRVLADNPIRIKG